MANLKRHSDSSILVREQPKEPWRDADWQNLWLVLKSKPWTSLAIVPGAAGASPDFSLQIAVTLARIGILHLGAQIHVADATKIPIVRLEQFVDEVRRLNEEGDLVLIALPPIEENPVTVSIAQAAHAAILCIMMEKMATAKTKQTISKIGAKHFLGSVVFHPDQMPSIPPEP